MSNPPRRKYHRRRRRHRRGTVLALILVLLALMAALAANLLHLSRLRHREKSYRLRMAELHASLTDAALRALQKLADNPDRACDHRGEAWYETEEYQSPQGISLWVQIRDENSRFDLNNIVLENHPPEQTLAQQHLMNLLTYFGDYDSLPRVRALAETIEHTHETKRFNLPRRHDAVDQPSSNVWLASFSEAAAIQEFSVDYFEARREPMRSPLAHQLTDHLTIIPQPRTRPVPVNVNTAHPILLRGLLGIGHDEWVTYLLGLRETTPLTSLDDLFGMIAPPTEADIWRPFLDVASTHFRITVRGFSAEHQATLHVQAHRNPADDSVRILRWVF